MEFIFANIHFEIKDRRIFIKKWNSCNNFCEGNFAEVQLAGQNKQSHAGVKMGFSSEGPELKYISHSISGNMLIIVQQTKLIEVKSIFTSYADANVVRVSTEIKNIFEESVVVEEISSLVIDDITQGSDTKDVFFTRFSQSHHTECQPVRKSFWDYGLLNCKNQPVSQKKIFCANIGSWSTKEELPQGIIETSAGFMMFQLESNAGWYYEISDRAGSYYLYLGGSNSIYGSWSRIIEPGSVYKTIDVCITFGDSLNDVVGNMTQYRRQIYSPCKSDTYLPTIFNEYMHLSWDNPVEEATMKYAEIVSKLGIDYYVIDCGWHNEEPGMEVYPYVGQWKESKSRFPHGIKKIMDYIRSLGMKPGLWIEPEVVGTKCKEMLDYYDDSCFVQRYGKRICANGRYFLDYRNSKVRNYMTDTISRMVEDYGTEYIKFDYNQELGTGTDWECVSQGEGIERCSEAFLEWAEYIINKYPNVIFENCASGGMRMDYRTLSLFSLASTSDQTDYLKYPYIAGNILSAVIPEQAAVWSYPVGECSKNEINDNQIVMNMINSFLGRMHLASHLDYMNVSQLELVKNGVEYYNSLTHFKKNAYPYFPLGFTNFDKEIVASGLKHDKKICLAVWNLSNSPQNSDIDIDNNISNVRISYPPFPNAKITYRRNRININFSASKSAVFLEIETK